MTDCLSVLPTSAHATRNGVVFAPRPLRAAGSILIIEDDHHLVSSLSRWLRRSGFDVLAAENGTVGLDLAELEDPDVVLLDLGLPGMRGFKVLHELRLVQPVTPVVIITGEPSRAVARRAIRCGARRVFHKPFKVQALIRSLEDLLS